MGVREICIAKIPATIDVFDSSDQSELVIRAREGDEIALEHLHILMFRATYKIIAEFWDKHRILYHFYHTLDDFIMEVAHPAMINAIEKFDLDKVGNSKFLSFVIRGVKWEIRKALEWILRHKRRPALLAALHTRSLQSPIPNTELRLENVVSDGRDPVDVVLAEAMESACPIEARLQLELRGLIETVMNVELTRSQRVSLKGTIAGKNSDDIAEELDQARSTVYMATKAALKKIRAALSDRLFYEDGKLVEVDDLRLYLLDQFFPQIANAHINLDKMTQAGVVFLGEGKIDLRHYDDSKFKSTQFLLEGGETITGAKLLSYARTNNAKAKNVSDVFLRPRRGREVDASKLLILAEAGVVFSELGK